MRLGDLPKVTQKVAKCVLICHDFSIPFSMTVHCQICFLKWTFFIPWKSGLRYYLVMICVFKEINYWFIFSFIYPISLYISHICNFKKTPCVSLWLLTQIAQVDWAPVLVKEKDEGTWNLKSYKLILSAFFFMLWFNKRQLSSVCIQFSSVAQSCTTLCNPVNRSTLGLPVRHQLPEFTQTRVHPIGDAIQPSHPLLSPSPPAPNPSQHQSLFQWVNSSQELAKVLEFQL